MLTRLLLPFLVVCVIVTPVLTAADSGMGRKRRHWSEKEHDIPDEQRLLTALLKDYHMYSRPVYNASEKVVIKFGLTLVQISDMDEVNQVLTINVWLEQEWEDERLLWDPKDYNGLQILRIPCEKIWLPDIVLYNSADDFTTGYMKSKAMVSSNGNVFWPPPAKFRSSCKIDITYFPFDDQVCELKFGSWTYDGFQVDITNRSAHVDLTNYVFSGEWELIDVQVRRTEMYYACCEEPYPDVRFTIIIRRKTLYYLFNIIFPCLWLTILSLLGFWLPPDSGEKITLGITVLLAFSVFMLLIAESMPATSEFVPLIGIYLTVTMAMTSMSIILTVFVLQLHHVGPHQKRVPRWMWTLVIEVLAPIVCLCHISQRYRYLGARLTKGQANNLGNNSFSYRSALARQEDIGMNALSAEALPPYDAGRGRGGGGAGGSEGGGSGSGGGGRRGGGSRGRGGRGNCNGIIISRSGPSVVGRDGGGSERGGRSDAERGRSDVETGVRFAGDGCGRGVGQGRGRGRPGSEGVVSSTSDGGSGSYVSVAAASSSAPSTTPAASGSGDSRGNVRGASNGSDVPARGGVAAPARRDPQSRPGEYIGGSGDNRGAADSAARAQPASKDSADVANDAKARVVTVAVDSDCDTGLGGSLPAADASSASPNPALRSEHPQDVARSKLPGAEPPTGATCESGRGQHRAAPRREDLVAEKLQSQAPRGSNPARSATEHVHGQAPPCYQPRHAQLPPSAAPAAARNYHGASRDYHVTSAMVGRDYNSDRITQHLQVLVSRDDEDDYHQDVVTEWRVVAHVMDRMLFWLFLLVAIVSSVLILIVKPLTKPEKWRHD